MCKVYTGYCGTSEIERGLCACTVDNLLAKARGLSLRTGAQTMLYLAKARGLSLHTGAQTMLYLAKARGLSLRTGVQTMLYLAKARRLSLRTGAQTMLCLSLVSCTCFSKVQYGRRTFWKSVNQLFLSGMAVLT